VKVPSVEGDLLADARRAIGGAGLEVDHVKRRFHDDVPLGHVIAVRPDRARLPQGTAVTLVVSEGPRPVPVPDVRGMAEGKAVQALSARGFEVVIERAFSNKVSRGDAVATDPAAGAEVQPGETVVLVVSLGPEYFACPNFVGMSVDEARVVAERHGLELTALEVPGGSGSNVVSQLPVGGTRVRSGSTVTVYYA
jgi:serine/threonine-protein kinase